MGAMGAIYTSRGPLTLPTTVGVHCQPSFAGSPTTVGRHANHRWQACQPTLVGTPLPAHDFLPLHDSSLIHDSLPSFISLRRYITIIMLIIEEISFILMLYYLFRCNMSETIDFFSPRSYMNFIRSEFKDDRSIEQENGKNPTGFWRLM